MKKWVMLLVWILTAIFNVSADNGGYDHRALADASLARIQTKYNQRVLVVQIPGCRHVDVVLCGTLHVAKTSSDMVRDIIQDLKPDFVALELCETRIDSLIEQQELTTISLLEVIKETIAQRSLKILGMGMLAWMQFKAAKVMGNKLGGELAVAAQEGARLNSVVVLADRQYGVTIQRVFDRLKMWEKLTMFCIMFWEVLTMTFFKLKDYIKKTEADDGFIQDEIKKLGKYLPSLADVIINERDEYLAQTVCEIARGSSKRFLISQQKYGDDVTGEIHRQRILAVIGAGHLKGLQKCLSAGGVSESRIAEIATSSKHPLTTWPGIGQLIIVNNAALFPSQTNSSANTVFAS